ncbi:helix-turn-helix transcriptional regulator [Limimaricola soesokkakensis]|uniref:helix-turn-helix transcriptional regulator n=1 Tax=Limimaricola soesokkakensis TaxID=1343159 RepID=UPI000A26BF02|nr:helix-turn-helix transcriptional regulator [Limimaricola soesokkakensis]
MFDLDVMQAELRSLIYGALLRENEWGAFLDHLTSLLPDAKATLFFHDANHRAGAFSITSGVDDTLSADYAIHYAPMNPWMEGATKRPVGLVVPDQRMLARAELLKSEFYNDFLRPQGVDGAIGVTLHREGSHNSLLSVMSSSAETHDEIGAQRALQSIVPDLQRAFTFYRRRSFPISSDVSGIAADDGDSGLISVGPGRRIRRCNRIAEGILASGHSLYQDAMGRLYSRDPSLIEYLDRCLLLWGRSRDDLPVRSFLLGSAPELPTRVTVIACISDRGERFFRGAECQLIVEPPPSRKVSIRDLQKFYRLTDAEARVCAALAAGATIQEIAASQGVGIETIRTHLRSARQKTGTDRQADLVWLVNRLADRFG